jgi:hypothetical protein
MQSFFLASLTVAALALAGATTPMPALGQASGPVCTVPDASFIEGDGGTIAVSLQATCDDLIPSDLEYHVATTDGTAAAPGDYAALDTTATATAGATQLDVALELVGDNDHEPDETFTVTLDDASGTVAFASPSATITIVDDDGPAVPGACITLTPGAVSAAGAASTPTFWRGLRSDRFTVTNCGDRDVHLTARGTDASGTAGTWRLLPWEDLNASTCDLGLNTFRAVAELWLTAGEGVATSLSTTDTVLLGDADSGAPFTLREALANEISISIQPPCIGSVGLGEPMAMDLTFTAIAP